MSDLFCVFATVEAARVASNADPGDTLTASS